MAGEVAGLLTPADLPDADALVEAGRDEPPAVGREGDAADLLGVGLEGADRGSARHLPELDRVVGGGAAGRHQLAVRAEGERGDLAGMPLEPAQLLPVCRVVEADRAVAAADGQRLAVGAVGEAVDASLRRRAGRTEGGERSRENALVQVPDADLLIAGTGDEEPAVRAVGEGVDDVVVAAWECLAVAGVEVPQPDELVAAGGGDLLALGMEGDRGDELGVAGERVDVLAVRDGPDADDPVLAAGGDLRAVRAECDAADRLHVPLVSAQLLAGGQVPKFDGRVAAAGREELAVGTDRQAEDRHRVPQLHAAEDPLDMGRQVGRERRDEPACPSDEVACLAELAGLEGRLRVFGVHIRPLQQFLGEFCVRPTFGRVDPLLAERVEELFHLVRGVGRLGGAALPRGPHEAGRHEHQGKPTAGHACERAG